MGLRARAGMVVLLLVCLGSLVLVPPTFAQIETVGDFLIKIANAAGLNVTTATDAIQALVKQKLITQAVGDSLAPQVNFQLTRGLMARILRNVLRLEPQLEGAPTQDIVNALAQRGIIPPGPAASIVTSEEVTAILTNPAVAAALSAAIIPVAVAAAIPGALPIALGVAAAAAVAGRAFRAASP